MLESSVLRHHSSKESFSLNILAPGSNGYNFQNFIDFINTSQWGNNLPVQETSLFSCQCNLQETLFPHDDL